MNTEPMLYSTGADVRAGDRVQYDGTFATVVFVSNGESEEFSPGYEDHAGSARIVLRDDDGGTSDLGEADERLSFVDRG